jgi:hypothetical protein
LPFHLRLSLLCGRFLLRSSTENLYIYILSFMADTYLTHLTVPDLHLITVIVFSEQYKVWIPSLYIFLHSSSSCFLDAYYFTNLKKYFWKTTINRFSCDISILPGASFLLKLRGKYFLCMLIHRMWILNVLVSVFSVFVEANL